MRLKHTVIVLAIAPTLLLIGTMNAIAQQRKADSAPASLNASAYDELARSVSSLALYLATRDLVIEGTILSVDNNPRPSAGGCGFEPGSAWIRQSIRIAVLRVLSGVAESDTLTINSPLVRISGDGFAPGARVIAWGYRNVEDSWQLSGGLVLLADGQVRLPEHLKQDPHLLNRAGLTPTYTNLLQDLDRLLPVQGISLFNGATGLALATVVSAESAPDRVYIYKLNYMRSLLGVESATAPETLRVRLPDYLVPVLSVGDSVLVPTDFASATGRVERATLCFNAILVKCNYVPSLGVAIDEIAHVTVIGSDGRIRIGFNQSRRER